MDNTTLSKSVYKTRLTKTQAKKELRQLALENGTFVIDGDVVNTLTHYYSMGPSSDKYDKLF